MFNAEKQMVGQQLAACLSAVIYHHPLSGLAITAFAAKRFYVSHEWAEILRAIIFDHKSDFKKNTRM